MAPEVVESVLEHNRGHALLLSMASIRSRSNLEYFGSLLRTLIKLGYVNRKQDSLPDDDELAERKAASLGLYRPELAVCVAGTKMWIKSALLASNLLEDSLLKHNLLDYFPKALQQRYPKEIAQHPLARNIIATQVTNDLVESIGISFIHRMCSTYSVDPVTVIKCSLAAATILESKLVRKALLKLDTPSSVDQFLFLTILANDALRQATAWLLEAHGHELTLAQMVEQYRESYKSLLDIPAVLFEGSERAAFDARLAQYTELGLDGLAARSLSVYPSLVEVLEVLWTTKRTKRPLPEVARSYGTIRDVLQARTVLNSEQQIVPGSKWENELMVSAFQEIRHSISQLVVASVEKNVGPSPDAIAQWLRKNVRFDALMGLFEELKTQPPGIAAASVVAKQLRSLVGN
jgi:glutamate dehydrogenase